MSSSQQSTALSDAEVKLEAPRPYSPRRKPNTQDIAARREKEALRKRAQRVGARIHVKGELANLHPLVEQTLTALESAKPDRLGFLSPTRVRALDIVVSAAQRDRALCILDAFVRGLERAGLEVRISNRGNRRSWAVVDGEDVGFSLKEGVNRVEHKPTPEERERLASPWYENDVPRWDESPSGRLRLRIERPGTKRATWSDTRRYRLEDSLDAAVRAVEETSADRAIARAAESERRRNIEERQRVISAEFEAREAERRRVSEEERRFTELREKVRLWREAQDLRAFAEALRNRLIASGAELSESGESARYLSWVEECATRLDPLIVG